MPDRLSKRHLMANRTVLNRNGNFDLLPKPNFLLWEIANILPETKLLPKTEASVQHQIFC